MANIEEAYSAENLKIVAYSRNEEIEPMIKMIESELSEPYSIFTYRYFLINWPQLCLLSYYKEEIIGCIIGKLENHRENMRGYIAMLVVVGKYRKQGIGKKLVETYINKVIEMGGDEVVLETEAVNKVAISFYTKLGFAKDKRMLNYYMSGNDAFRLKLWLKKKENESTKEKKKEEVDEIKMDELKI